MSVMELSAAFAGGLGLFMLGMRLMTDGLKLAAGRMLEDLLATWTRTRLRGLFAGILITAVVQSSSAVTVATIGFVNAGLLDLGQALWVVFGTNVGTTVTAWLVAATGLEVKLDALALPMIGVGMLLELTGGRARRGAIGKALAGFGLFFLGLEVLKNAFTTLGDSVDLSQFAEAGIFGGVVFFLVGTALTVVMQSSSAALAITLTAAGGGLITLQDAGAMVIGANVGTTSTAVFAVLGATPAAKRVAIGHAAFNLAAAIAALLMLPWILDAIVAGIEAFDATPSFPAVLALFHTVFNILGVLTMWPLSRWLVRTLEKRFVTAEEGKGTPRHLDKTVLEVPEVGVRAINLELARAARHAGELTRYALKAEEADEARLAAARSAFDRLMEAISTAITELDRAALRPELSERLQILIRGTRHLTVAVDQAEVVAELRREVRGELPELVRFEGALGDAFRAVIDVSNPEREGFEIAKADEALGRMQELLDQTRSELLGAAARGERKAAAAMAGQHLMAETRRALRHLVRAVRDIPAPAMVHALPTPPEMDPIAELEVHRMSMLPLQPEAATPSSSEDEGDDAR